MNFKVWKLFLNGPCTGQVTVGYTKWRPAQNSIHGFPIQWKALLVEEIKNV